KDRTAIENSHNNYARAVESEVAVPHYSETGRCILEYEDPRFFGQVEGAVHKFEKDSHDYNAEDPVGENNRPRVPFAREFF
ncbi:hypothetical protein PFISCL1PPCAC_14482, partial [Pristionchus fissidentatus]